MRCEVGHKFGEDGHKFVEVLEIPHGKKIKFSIFHHLGVRKFRLDKRIPNLVYKLKTDSILPLLAKKLSKIVKSCQNSPIC